MSNFSGTILTLCSSAIRGTYEARSEVVHQYYERVLQQVTKNSAEKLSKVVSFAHNASWLARS